MAQGVHILLAVRAAVENGVRPAQTRQAGPVSGALLKRHAHRDTLQVITIIMAQQR
jgi:hypothetical protein